MSTIHFGQETVVEFTLTTVSKTGTSKSVQDVYVLGNPKEAYCALQKKLVSIVTQRSAKLTTRLMESISIEQLEEVAEWCEQLAVNVNTVMPKLTGVSYKYAKSLQQFIKVTNNCSKSKSLDEIFRATVFETSFGNLLSIECKETGEEVFNALVSLTPQAYAPVTAVSTKPVAKVEPAVKLTAAPVAMAPAAVAPTTAAPTKRVHPSLLRAQARQWAKAQFGR